MRHALKKGDVIGIFSPSYPLTALAPEATRAAIRYLENQGYRIKPGRLCGKQDFYRPVRLDAGRQEITVLKA